MSKATTVVDENISDGLIVNKHDDTDTTKDAEEAETRRKLQITPTKKRLKKKILNPLQGDRQYKSI